MAAPRRGLARADVQTHICWAGFGACVGCRGPPCPLEIAVSSGGGGGSPTIARTGRPRRNRAVLDPEARNSASSGSPIRGLPRLLRSQFCASVARLGHFG